jgi:hypothetical protein
MSRGELHHHRFLERTAIRVTIATLWQTGYTINENVRVRQAYLTKATKREQYLMAPSAPASAGGEPCGAGVRGRDLSIALGVAT